MKAAAVFACVLVACVLPAAWGYNYTAVNQNKNAVNFPMAALTEDLQVDVLSCNDDARLWIRLFFHDFGTFDVTDGSGGIDGSIQFELDRPENRGLSVTVEDFIENYAKKHGVSLADVIVLGGNMAVRACGGPYIPFFSGRVDATSANKPGLLPGANDDITKLVNDFARMGLTPREMVCLVGGGHTVGFVHKENSPEVDLSMLGFVPNSRRSMDRTMTNWDNLYFQTLNPVGIYQYLVSLPTFKLRADLEFLKHPETLKAVNDYASNPIKFLFEFISVFTKCQKATLPKTARRF